MATSNSRDDYIYAPEERPTFPGSPGILIHTAPRRAAYGAVAVLVAVSATFGNALVNVNVGSAAGSLGLYVAEASVLPAIYVAMNASANLTLVKARAQFGIPTITQGLLIVYALAGAWQLVFPGFASAVLIRAICGVTAAALTTLAIYYLLQTFPGRLRPLALVFGIGLVQLGTPLARLVPVELLAAHEWRGLYLIEIAIALTVLALTAVLPLPHSERSPAFEKADIVTIALLVPAYLLVCVVLGLGRLYWWTDAPWLGVALACAIPLFTGAVLLERSRANPLIRIDWLSSLDILRFAGVAVFVRLALAEQTFGAVGFLTSGGLTNDQLHTLFAIVAVAMVLGMICAALTLSETRLPYQVAVAALIIAAGAWIDTDANNLSRPPQLYLSQALIGFGTTLFIGPAILYGFVRMFAHGATHLVSFIVLFSTTQNVGGLAGSAWLGSYQIAATRYHITTLSERLSPADPQVVSRLQSGAAVVSGVVVDPAARIAQGSALLNQAAAREAGVLAYIDVFAFVRMLALSIAAYIAYLLLLAKLRGRSVPAVEAPST